MKREGVYRWRGGEVEDGREGEHTFGEAVPAGIVTVEEKHNLMNIITRSQLMNPPLMNIITRSYRTVNCVNHFSP